MDLEGVERENMTLGKTWVPTAKGLKLLVVSTHLKNMSEIGSFPQARVKIKNVWNHQLVKV